MRTMLLSVLVDLFSLVAYEGLARPIMIQQAGKVNQHL